MKKFEQIYTEFHGEEITDVKQLAQATFTGEELKEFCEFFSDQQNKELREKVEKIKLLEVISKTKNEVSKEKLNDIIVTMAKSRMEWRQAVRDRNTEIQRLTTENKELREKVRALDDHRIKIEEMERLKKETSDGPIKILSEITQRSAEDWKRLHDRQYQECIRQQSKIQHLTNEVEKLREDAALAEINSQAEIQRLTKEVHALQAEKDSWPVERDQVLKDADKTITALTKRIDTLYDCIGSLTSDKDSLTKEVEKWRERHSAQVGRAFEKTQELTRLRELLGKVEHYVENEAWYDRDNPEHSNLLTEIKKETKQNK